MSFRETLTVERPAAGGAVGRLEDGRAIFVRYALPGETVEVEVIEEHATYARGEAVAVLTPSPDRVASPCAYFHPGGCGGCDLLMATSEAQRAWKKAVVEEQLRRVGGLSVTVEVEDAGPFEGSRTRLRCAVDKTGHLALRKKSSHDLMAVNACLVGDVAFGEALTADWTGAREVELRGLGDDEPFAVVAMHDDGSVTSDLDGLIDDEPRRSSVTVRGVRYRVSAGSFWQAHRKAPEILVEAVLAAARAKRGGAVVDLYAGVGLFTVPLAKAVGEKGTVIAIESGRSSAADAKRNVADLPHVSVIAKAVSPRLLASTVQAGDVVVVDPPRAGLTIANARALAERKPSRVVYVSCDAATFARDAKELLAQSYSLVALRAFDLFPGTEHVELLGVFEPVTR